MKSRIRTARSLRAFAAFTLGLATVLSAAVAAGTVSAGAATVGVTSAHPFSDPIWFPFHTSVRMYCAGSSTDNNGPKPGSNPCSADHQGYFAINFAVPYKIAGGALNPVPHPSIYAAGAGVVIKTITSSRPCTSGSSAGAGNEVWISHGGGIVSVYQHLLKVTVRNGQLVSPRNVIGTAGATGVPCTSSGAPATAYLDFAVRHWGGTSALSQSIPTLVGCVGTTTTPAAWPSGLTRSHFTMASGRAFTGTLPRIWTQVPLGVGVRVDTGWNCVRGSGYGTPNPVTGLRLAKSGSRATLTWTAMSGAGAYNSLYNVQLQVPRGSSWGVPCSPFVQSSCTYGFYTYRASGGSHFIISRTGTYRMRVSAHNGAGWSNPTAWVTVR